MASIQKQIWDPYYIYIWIYIYIYNDVTIYVYTSMHAFGVYSFIYKFIIYYLFLHPKKSLLFIHEYLIARKKELFNIIS